MPTVGYSIQKSFAAMFYPKNDLARVFIFIFIFTFTVKHLKSSTYAMNLFLIMFHDMKLLSTQRSSEIMADTLYACVCICVWMDGCGV